jgi:hypothetical protein
VKDKDARCSNRTPPVCLSASEIERSKRQRVFAFTGCHQQKPGYAGIAICLFTLEGRGDRLGLDAGGWEKKYQAGVFCGTPQNVSMPVSRCP